MSTVKMEFSISNKELVLDYVLQTEKCSWSIFDLGGVELCKGRLDGNGPHVIPIACLAPSHYQLCVIDGDKLLNSRFSVS